MPKASPLRNSFNAGEFSILVEGRVDIDRYASSMRSMLNFIAAPQGPAIRRSGTRFNDTVYDESKVSALLPFIFSDEQALQMEFAHNRIRFHLEEGVQTYDPVACTVVSGVVTAAALDAAVGDQIVFSGFPSDTNINAITANILTKSGSDYTVDVAVPDGSGFASLVYHIESPYESADVQGVRVLQSVDVVYLFHPKYRTHKLSRFDAYDWRIEEILFDNGPFMDTDEKMGRINIGSTGSPVSGGTAISNEGVASRAFDQDTDLYWEPTTTTQRGWVGYIFPAPVVITGYVIYPATLNDNETYSALDYTPADFEFQGSNDGGTTWDTLDKHIGYLLYEAGRSVHFKINNDVAYERYRLDITACRRNGNITPRVGYLAMTTPDETLNAIAITVTGDYDNLNKGQGFLSTDVGRLIRLKASDQSARVLRITSRTSATEVTAQLLDEPFPTTKPVLEWQLGHFSDTTGWPTCGAFFEDRMWVAGIREAPDLLAGSRTGAYEDFQQRSPTNEVLDDSAVAVRLNSRKLSRIRWLATDERGLLAGTGTAEHVISAARNDDALTARNIKGRSSSERGSADLEPVKIDRQILYVQASRRTVREYAYVFEADGYKSPSMSLFASHLGVPRFAEMDYSSEPHSIVWIRRDDGSVVGLTYNREENVIGWHRHDFGGVVESISVIPSAEGLQDTLWMVVKRIVNGVTRRYVERLTRFWDFDSVVEDAHFVDSGLRYEGAPVDTVYGLSHLEGEAVQGLADGVPFEAVVQNGSVSIPFEASKIVVGLPFESYGEPSRPEAGSEDGTAQGKTKRPHNVVAHLWDSAFGEVGRYNESLQEMEWAAIEYDEPFDELQPINLQTNMFGPMILPSGYGKRGTVAFRQTMPLPFNIISLLPQLHTQDR